MCGWAFGPARHNEKQEKPLYNYKRNPLIIAFFHSGEQTPLCPPTHTNITMKRIYQRPNIKVVRIASSQIMAASFDVNGTAGIERGTGTAPTYGASKRYTIFDEESIFEEESSEEVDF